MPEVFKIELSHFSDIVKEDDADNAQDVPLLKSMFLRKPYSLMQIVDQITTASVTHHEPRIRFP